MTLEEIRSPSNCCLILSRMRAGLFGEHACPLLEKTHGLDLSYLKTIDQRIISAPPYAPVVGGCSTC
jgi:hypothetical protein